MPRNLRLLQSARLRNGRATLLISAPKAGRVSAQVTLPGNRRTGAGPFTTILTGEMRVKRAGRVRLRLNATPAGERALAQAQARADEGGRRLLPAQGDPLAADALGPVLVAAWSVRAISS